MSTDSRRVALKIAIAQAKLTAIQIDIEAMKEENEYSRRHSGYPAWYSWDFRGKADRAFELVAELEALNA